MTKTIIHVLCEGQTESGFVSAVLKPYLRSLGIEAVKPVLISTSPKKDAKGGIISYSQVKSNLSLLFAQERNGEFERHIFTTMIDLYAIPKDFPGYDVITRSLNMQKSVEAFEKAFGDDISKEGFIPYIQLHEFEALLFCQLDYLVEDYPKSRTDIGKLKADCEKYDNPELIDNGEATAPSKRIIKAVEGTGSRRRYKYNKVLAGKTVTSKIGIEVLRSQCPHFNLWIQKLMDA